MTEPFGPPMTEEYFQAFLEKALAHAEGEKDIHVSIPTWALKRILWDWKADRENYDRVSKTINTPEIEDFLKGVRIEAAHQKEHWPAEHDEEKTDEDWFWTLGYLAGKALAALRSGDRTKHLHHLVSSAALLFNWHAQAKARMK